MWTVFLARIRRRLCFQTRSGLLVVPDPVERTMARLGVLRPLRSHRPCLEFTASTMQYTRAAPCLPRATARCTMRTHCTAARLTRTAYSPRAAAIRGRDPSPLRRTNITGCTPGWEPQVCPDSVSYMCRFWTLGSMLSQNIGILTLAVSGSINFVKPLVLHGKNRKTFIAQLMSSAAINSFGQRFCVFSTQRPCRWGVSLHSYYSYSLFSPLWL